VKYFIASSFLLLPQEKLKRSNNKIIVDIRGITSFFTITTPGKRRINQHSAFSIQLPCYTPGFDL